MRRMGCSTHIVISGFAGPFIAQEIRINVSESPTMCDGTKIIFHCCKMVTDECGNSGATPLGCPFPSAGTEYARNTRRKAAENPISDQPIPPITFGGQLRGYARSTAKRLRSPSEQWAKEPSWVARKTTRGARFASKASCQRAAQRHQRSPGFRPGKPNSGNGVERSLPRDLENSRNAEVITAQTVWLPMSSRPVLQQPSR